MYNHHRYNHCHHYNHHIQFNAFALHVLVTQVFLNDFEPFLSSASSLLTFHSFVDLFVLIHSMLSYIHPMFYLHKNIKYNVRNIEQCRTRYTLDLNRGNVKVKIIYSHLVINYNLVLSSLGKTLFFGQLLNVHPTIFCIILV